MFTILLSYVWTDDRNVESSIGWYTTNSMDKEVRKIQIIKQVTGLIVFSSGDLGNRWRYGHVTVQSYSPFQMAFEGTVGASYQV